ncbi:octaprenyl diphosphate synthase [Thioflexithrix psekupsensis]|uniref:Octaprenyl diphosphate synthase n=1 Tax=Thioflexithrix psekupsensis TaxID=1570016 RepID=A0A251X869_9GAMM|nr:octaprenyl diphosphate synthase [Thioflexithrix psekupsensis]OUD14249.1 octaprenyl diphosphate synthase [Thioflexithrix psekupsensis]
MDIAAIQSLVSQDMQAVNHLIQQRLQSNVALINQLSHYIISSGGKRLRPMLVLLSAGASAYRQRDHIMLAAVIEFIHTATLLHDDVVDASSLRRGQQTANSIWGNEASVLVGDFLYSRAFQMMVEVQQMRVMDILSNATNVIAEGEVLQLLNCHEPDTTEESYLQVIRSKTAKLFEAAAQLGAVLAGQSAAVEMALASYGMHLGTAFQLIDDVLDYSATPEEMGKNVGDDLAEGKPTLPLIYTLRHASSGHQAVVREAIVQGGRDCIGAVIAAIESTEAIDYTAQAARVEAEKAVAALSILPDSPYVEALRGLAHFSIHRTY